VCGGPRISAAFGGEPAAAALREQKKLLTHARLASVATLVQALFAAMVTLLGLVIAPASVTGKVVVLPLALAALVLALRSRSRARRARTDASRASERAWQAAAEDVAAHARGGVTAAALASTLGLEPEHADRLLTTLAVHDRTRIDVGDDAEVRYSVAPDALRGTNTEAFDEHDGAARASLKEPLR
jgi:hypothetical protein